MMYALIGFLGVLIGAACVHLCMPEQDCSDCCIQETAPQTEEDMHLLRQWQNLLNFTADAGGDDDEANS